MRRYETFVIFDPDIVDENRVEFFEKMKNLILEKDGYIACLDEWGVRKLAYEIKKKVRGHYTRIDYLTSSDVVQEMERLFRIDDRVMKYMTIILDKDADLEKVQKEMSGEEEKEEEDTKTSEKAEDTENSSKTVEEAKEASDSGDSDTTASEDVKDKEPAKEEDK